MDTPIQISFEHVEHSDAIEHRLLEEFDKLEQFYGRLTTARVVVDKEQRSHNKGDGYSVRLILSVPGAEDIAVTRDPIETGRLNVAISDAFAAARRKLQDLARKRQRHPKANLANPMQN